MDIRVNSTIHNIVQGMKSINLPSLAHRSVTMPALYEESDNKRLYSDYQKSLSEIKQEVKAFERRVKQR